MEESKRKFFKPSSVQECNGFVSIIICKHAAAAILMGQITGTTQEDHQMLVVATLETLPLTHWELA
jgi:hypothetical protein